MTTSYGKTYDSIESIDMGDLPGIDAQSQLRYMRSLQVEAIRQKNLKLLVRIQSMIMRAMRDYGLFPKPKKKAEKQKAEASAPEKKRSPSEKVQEAAEALYRAMVEKGFRRDWQKALTKKLEKHFGQKFDRQNPPTPGKNAEPDPAEWDGDAVPQAA